MRGVTAARFARYLTSAMNRCVIDTPGRTGLFDIDLHVSTEPGPVATGVVRDLPAIVKAIQG